jgi:hypothetical protein
MAHYPTDQTDLVKGKTPLVIARRKNGLGKHQAVAEMKFHPLRLLHGLSVNAGDIGTKEHERYVAQAAKNQTNYSQYLNHNGVEFSGYILQSNSRKCDG